MISEFKMHELLWQEDKEIKRFRESDRLGCIYYGGPEDQSEDSVLQENLEDTPFTKAIRNAVMRRAPTSLRNSVVVLFCK